MSKVHVMKRDERREAGPLPRLDEVFLVQNRNLINVGSAYSRKPVAGPTSGSRTLAGYVFRKRMVSEASMKPELEKVVQKHASQLAKKLGVTGGKMGVDYEDILTDALRAFAHELEGAEAEDPAELDQGGPAPGTTGQG